MKGTRLRFKSKAAEARKKHRRASLSPTLRRRARARAREGARGVARARTAPRGGPECDTRGARGRAHLADVAHGLRHGRLERDALVFGDDRVGGVNAASERIRGSGEGGEGVSDRAPDVARTAPRCAASAAGGTPARVERRRGRPRASPAEPRRFRRGHPSSFFFPASGRLRATHLSSQDAHISASSAQHTSVAGTDVHTSQNVFIADAGEGVRATRRREWVPARASVRRFFPSWR